MKGMVELETRQTHLKLKTTSSLVLAILAMAVPANSENLL